jgi:transposase
MEKTDARKLGKEVQQELRYQVIRLRKQGRRNQEVAQIVGVSVPHASTIWQKYRKGGKRAIQIRVRGRRAGEQRTLTKDQERQIQRLLVNKMPDQLKLPFALWTRKAIRQLIKHQYGITMPIRTVGEYLKRWGFTVRKPVKRAYEQNPAEVNRWLQEEYPALAVRAKKEKAEIYWGDETGLQTAAYQTRGFAPRGKKPVVRISARKNRISMISAVNNGGQMRFMLYRKGITAQLLIKFMRRLIKDAQRKVFLIVDNLRVHHSQEVMPWIQAHQEQIALFHLPSYSPELNPDEYLNNDLKAKVHGGLPAHTEKELLRKTLSHMKSIAMRPKRVKSYFKHPSVAYAA